MDSTRFLAKRHASRRARKMKKKNREAGFGVQRYIRDQKAMSGDKWRPEWVAN